MLELNHMHSEDSNSRKDFSLVFWTLDLGISLSKGSTKHRSGSFLKLSLKVQSLEQIVGLFFIWGKCYEISESNHKEGSDENSPESYDNSHNPTTNSFRSYFPIANCTHSYDANPSAVPKGVKILATGFRDWSFEYSTLYEISS